MKITLLFSTLLAGLSIQQANGQNQPQAEGAPIQQTASLSKQRYQLRFGSYYEQSAKQLVTVLVQPDQTHYGQNISLPLGVDTRTVTVKLGELPLRLETDYVWLPNTNRLQIVNQAILKSDQLLRVTYERPNFIP